ncbi:MAG: DMT family transporter [Clostridia bacterium]|nr:DMT family transporter [Clostridia bacterium]
MNKQKLKGNLMMLLTALIWGTAFVAQSSAMDSVDPFSFMAARNLLGAIVLIPVILIFSDKKAKSDQKNTWIGGVVCGAILFVASALQQYGLVYTTTAKAGFITTLYVVLVPLAGLFLGKKVMPVVWISVLLSVVGFYFLCINENFTLAPGDLLVLLCAVAFTVHIMVIDHFSPKADGIKMSCIQFLVCGLLSLLFSLICGPASPQALLSAWIPILYTGILSSGVAYTLQILAQKFTDAVMVSLIGSLEAVFATLFGFLFWKIGYIDNGNVTLQQLGGCALVFAAVILVQLPLKKGEKYETS